MDYVHVVTVGASLASNYEKEQPSPIRDIEVETKLSQLTEADKVQYCKKLLEYIHQKERQGKRGAACAEINALSRFLNEISMVYLIHTDTELGRCCSHAIREYLVKANIQVPDPIEINGLHKAESFHKGLASLLLELSKLLVQHKNTRICATGGYKPEVALASALGFIARAPVYYIHESFDQEIHLPAVPIDWKYELKKYEEAIDAILAAGTSGIEKKEFIQNFGSETRDYFIRNWLLEETANTYKATEVSLAILQAIRTLKTASS